MTGIVGPNGSGKSNIAEAIRWVLGEQSAKNLRGSRMPDVIFSGSADRRSLNMAAVTLLLDNSDHYLDSPYSEIKVSRKLFRNGDSSYFINEKQCRLKDIASLFMDTGIGQGSLSIISQGNVEEIFNSKPVDVVQSLKTLRVSISISARKRRRRLRLSRQVIIWIGLMTLFMN